MNEWVKKSIDIANAPGYLDKLHAIYPVTQESERLITTAVQNRLKQIYHAGDDATLIKELLRLPKFPVKDPYVAFLRKRPIFINYNPRTVARIAGRVRSMGYSAMIESIQEPKEFNRQIGTLFKRWLPKLGYPILTEDDFKTDTNISFLQGSDTQLKNYANAVANCELDKGPDILAKVGKTYLIAEAKFLTDVGGHQNAQFEDALRLLKGKKGTAIRIALLDGVLWIKDHAKMYRTVSHLKETALTALLLKPFLESLKTT